MAFRLDRSLLKPNFDGYKYSPNFLNVKSTNLAAPPKEITVDDSFYDFDHLKLLSLTNGLYFNEFNDADKADCVVYYFSDDGNVIRIELKKNSDNLKISQVTNEKIVEEDTMEYPPAMLFVRNDLCLISHSNSKISIFQIVYNSEKEEEEHWEFCDSIDLMTVVGKFYCYSATFCQQDQCIRVALCTICRNAAKINSNKQNRVTIVDIHFRSCDTVLKLTDIKERAQFNCETVPNLSRFISFDNSHCCFISEGNIYNEVCEQDPTNGATEVVSKNFTWSQTLDMITIRPTLLFRSIDTDKIDCSFKSQSLHFVWLEGDGTSKLNLEAKFFKPIVENSCRWTVSDENKLEIHIIKEEPVIWPQLFFDNAIEDSINSSIEHIFEGEETHYLSEAVSSLDAFTTSNENELGKGLAEDDYNELDCGNYQELYLIDLNDQSVKKIETNATQLLFSSYKAPTHSLNICMDNMEDGIVWNVAMKDQRVAITHETTFHALAYIAATKRDAIFRMVERTHQSYFFIVDCNGLVFVYENPNLSTSSQSKARQSSFNIRERPIGAATLASKIIILTKTALHVANVNI